MWIKLDDGFAMNPKILKAGAIPALIQIRAICYASQHKTDGYIPLTAIPLLLTGLEELSVDVGTVGDYAGLASQATDIEWPPHMVTSGLWEVREGGYYIHDYLEWNLSKKEYETYIKKKSKAGKKGMKSRWNKENSDITGVISDVITDVITKPYQTTSTSTSSISPLSSSESDPKIKSNGQALRKPGKPTQFPEEFVFCDEVKSQWSEHGIDPAIEFAKFRDHHRARGTLFTDWKAAWRNWARNAIKFKEERHVRPMR